MNYQFESNSLSKIRNKVQLRRKALISFQIKIKLASIVGQDYKLFWLCKKIYSCSLIHNLVSLSQLGHTRNFMLNRVCTMRVESILGLIYSYLEFAVDFNFKTIDCYADSCV